MTKTTYIAGAGLIFGFVFSAPLALALESGDFFCKPLPPAGPNFQAEWQGAPPQYIESGSKTCDGKAESLPGVCLVTAWCTAVLKDTKTGAKAATGKDYASLNGYEKAAYVDKNTAAGDWLRSQLVCPALTPPQGGTVAGHANCPVPDECKGDLLYNVSTATFAAWDPDSLKRSMNRVGNHGPAFPGDGAVPPAEAAPANAPAAAPAPAQPQ